MAGIFRRDAIVFFHPPKTKLSLGGELLTCFSSYSSIDRETGEIRNGESWWTAAAIQEHGVTEKAELPPPVPGEIYYEGPVWPDDPQRTLVALEEFLSKLPVLTTTLYVQSKE